MAEQQNSINTLFNKVIESPVYNDAGSTDAIFPPEGVEWAANNMVRLMGAVATGAAETFGSAFSQAPEKLENLRWKAALRVTIYEAILTQGKANSEAQAAFDLMVAGMYIPNDLVDSGDEWSGKAMTAIDHIAHAVSKRRDVESDDPLVRAIASPMDRVKEAALPEDQPYLLDGVYQRILRREVGMRRFSNGYVEAEDKAAFIARHAKKIAEISSISAGARDIADGVYALIRREDATLPSLAVIEENEYIGEFRQVLNTYARLLDDLGDCEKDGIGVDGGPDKDTFSINVFNQAEPELIEAYCDYGKITGQRKEQLTHLISQFAEEKNSDRKQGYKTRITQLLTGHMREFTEYTSSNTRGLEEYMTMCKRVATISHVNVVGDDNMTTNV